MSTHEENPRYKKANKMHSESSPLKRVQEDSRIIIQFKLTLVDGTLVDETEQNETFEIQIGDGQLLHKLDELLIGLEEGTKAKFTLPPEEAFGLRSDENIQTMPSDSFGKDLMIQTGLVIGFASPTGDEIPGEIVAVSEETVTVDFNHPLSGQVLIFEVTIDQVLV